jgi:hypothetical protein
MAILRNFFAKGNGPFVIPSSRLPKTVLRGDYYTITAVGPNLSGLVRGSGGIVERKPLYTPRKKLAAW